MAAVCVIMGGIPNEISLLSFCAILMLEREPKPAVGLDSSCISVTIT